MSQVISIFLAYLFSCISYHCISMTQVFLSSSPLKGLCQYFDKFPSALLSWLQSSSRGDPSTGPGGVGGFSTIKLFYNEKTAEEETAGPALPVHLEKREQGRSEFLTALGSTGLAHCSPIAAGNTGNAALERLPFPADITKATGIFIPLLPFPSLFALPSTNNLPATVAEGSTEANFGKGADTASALLSTGSLNSCPTIPQSEAQVRPEQVCN